MPDPYLIIYDIGELDSRMRRLVNRRLRKLRAQMVQHSVRGSSDLGELRTLADLICSAGGEALVQEKMVVHPPR